MKHSLSEAQKEMMNNEETNTTYDTTDAHTRGDQ